ncbi:shieldin complex subunit 2 isoform X2 [Lepus europaeus]|nr:shieldin complex subunit 2 isoform X2 [Lepus europaeus]XP_062070903.1 shieldin complex subunit 2 isoform X2 [Lepus europaeus]XP_062070904.1 shieldin complex subunit 2 isoform X2 [Lepus europaeus]XP_062070905.1 shieldin complex subunit 2 isoform X2 [Lepus europaeus]XP_062070906.1 shieldin complex subunit 2 isoform X2 [Lepus europaeus]
MSRGSQVHVFWGAPVGPLQMTVSQETASLTPTADPWKEIQLLCDGRALRQRDESLERRSLGDAQVPEATAPAELPGGPRLVNPVSRSVPEKDDFTHSVSETWTAQSEQIQPSGPSDVSNPHVQAHAFQGGGRRLTEEGQCPEPQQENEEVTREEPKTQSDGGGPHSPTDSFRFSHEGAAVLGLVCSTGQMMGPGAVETRCVPAEHRETQAQRQAFFSTNTEDTASSEGADRELSNLQVSADTEFLSVLTCSQLAFLAQKEDHGQKSAATGTADVDTEPETSGGEVTLTADDANRPRAPSAEGSDDGQSQAHSLELCSPVCPDTKTSPIPIDSDEALEEGTGSEELFSSEGKLPPDEIAIELCSSGVLCSQRSTSPKRAVKRTRASEDSSAAPDVPCVPRKMKRASHAAMVQRRGSAFKGVRKTSLIKHCHSKSQKYNCLVVVLSPCHVREVHVKSGPSAGSKVPLATITVTDQSEMTKKVSLWRTAAFWALTVFLGDVILLTDVTVHEDQWAGEMVLQSTFTSQLLNLGSHLSVQPEEHSSIVSGDVLRDLLAYVSSKHPYLRDLPRRQPQKGSSVEFVDLEQLQCETLVHAVLRVVDITVLTEASYNYRGQRQRKVIVTVEQTQGQHYVLVLWGPGASWYPQLQRKKDCIWEFKYLFVQPNGVLENLELHTTPWSSCECLFDDDIRAITFKAKFQKNPPSSLKVSDLATHLQDKCSGVILIKAQILELAFPTTAAQKIALNAHTSLKSVFSSLPQIIYTGCAKCGLELETDENKIYKQCFNCLPCMRKKIYYRPALMTVADGSHKVCIHVGSKLIEKMLLNIAPDCLDRLIVPSSKVTYGMVAADLLHSLLAGSGEPRVLTLQSLFVLDENSYPLQQDFSLLDFHPNNVKNGASAFP